MAGFNTSTIGTEDNLAKGGSTTSYTLDAAGNQVLVKKAALGESVLGILTAHIHYNSSKLTPNIVRADRINGDLYMTLYNVTAALDLTTINNGNMVFIRLLFYMRIQLVSENT